MKLRSGRNLIPVKKGEVCWWNISFQNGAKLFVPFVPFVPFAPFVSFVSFVPFVPFAPFVPFVPLLGILCRPL